LSENRIISFCFLMFFVVRSNWAGATIDFFYSLLQFLYLVCPDVDIVIIHDAVRPIVDEETVTDVVNAALEHGASIIYLCYFFLLCI